MTYTGTLLPQNETPLENQKATLDLLKKINAVSDAIPAQVESLAIITSDTLLGSNIRNVIVNTALAINITIPEGLPVGTEIQITQVFTSTNDITLIKSGNDTIEGASSISYGINISSLTIMKISKTNWSRVKGAGIIESYDDPTTGIHVEKRSDRTMRIYGTVSLGAQAWTAGGSGWYRGDTNRLLPESFVGTYHVLASIADSSVGNNLGFVSYAGIIDANHIQVYEGTYNTARTANAWAYSFEVIGYYE